MLQNLPPATLLNKQLRFVAGVQLIAVSSPAKQLTASKLNVALAAACHAHTAAYFSHHASLLPLVHSPSTFLKTTSVLLARFTKSSTASKLVVRSFMPWTTYSGRRMEGTRDSKYFMPYSHFRVEDFVVCCLGFRAFKGAGFKGFQGLKPLCVHSCVCCVHQPHACVRV